MVEAKTDVRFTIKWTAPASQMFTGYKVTLREGDNAKTKTSAQDVTYVEITGLTAGTEYSIMVVTVNNDDESSALTGKTSTCKFTLMLIYQFIYCFYYYHY